MTGGSGTSFTMASLEHKIFKLIVLHNKLMEEKDLDFFLKEDPVPDKAMQRMVMSNMVAPEIATKVLQLYHRKLEKEKAALGSTPGSSPGSSPGSPRAAAAPKPAAKPAPTHAPARHKDDEEPIPLDDDDEDQPAPKRGRQDDDGMIPLVLEGHDANEVSDKVDEVGWVDDTDGSSPAGQDDAGPQAEAIDLVDDFERHEIVKSGDAAISMAASGAAPAAMTPSPGQGQTPPPATVKTQAHKAPVPGDEAIDDSVHIECDVPPQTFDPLAMKLLAKAVQLGASDMHLTAGSSPFFRLNGQLAYTDLDKLTPEQTHRIVLGFMDEAQQQHFLHHHDLDFSFEHELGRFRVNALQHFRGPGIIFRIIPKKVPTLASLGLPDTLARFTEYHQGLVLVTGPAGCGKTTTAAALIDIVNEHRKDHVITVEDPVEFLHPSKNCNITQRQVPIHTKSFASALKAALREDPDVIMIGEMRDLETVSLAIRAAETGHLVIGTLQTKSAARTIDRVIDVFPEDQQAQIRAMLSESLRGIISQQLLPRKDGKGRVVALEVLNVVTSVSNLIRDAKTFQLPSLMQTGRKQGQVMMDDSLHELVKQGLITEESAARAAENPKRFRADLSDAAAAKAAAEAAAAAAEAKAAGKRR